MKIKDYFTCILSSTFIFYIFIPSANAQQSGEIITVPKSIEELNSTSTDGTKILKDGTIVLKDGTKMMSNGDIILPDGSIIKANEGSKL